MKLLRFFLPVAFFLIATHSEAQKIFMKVMDGTTQINGESVQTNFVNWSEISAFNGGSTMLLSAGGVGGQMPSRPETKCFTVSMLQDRTGYFMKRMMYDGDMISSIQLDFTKSTGSQTPGVYYRVLLQDVFVTSIEEAGSEGELVKMNVSFVPRKFRYTYWPQNPNTGQLGNPVIFGWDLGANIPWNN